MKVGTKINAWLLKDGDIVDDHPLQTFVVGKDDVVSEDGKTIKHNREEYNIY